MKRAHLIQIEFHPKHDLIASCVLTLIILNGLTMKKKRFVFQFEIVWEKSFSFTWVLKNVRDNAT